MKQKKIIFVYKPLNNTHFQPFDTPTTTDTKTVVDTPNNTDSFSEVQITDLPIEQESKTSIDKK